MFDPILLIEQLKSADPVIKGLAVSRAKNLNRDSMNELIRAVGGVTKLTELISGKKVIVKHVPRVIAPKVKLFSVLIGMYGNYPQYSIRSLKSVISKDRNYDIHVGCNQCCKETVDFVRSALGKEEIDSVIETRHNINKDPMMRLLIERTETKFMMWMDDDSHCKAGWYSVLQPFLEQHLDIDCAGHVHYCHRDDKYSEFLTKRPWWRGVDSYADKDHQSRVWFATGGLFVAKTEFLRKHDFPDNRMVKRQDDLLLGDLISQQHGKISDFPQAFMNLIKISDGNRRGTGEGTDGWRQV